MVGGLTTATVPWHPPSKCAWWVTATRESPVRFTNHKLLNTNIGGYYD